MHNSLTLGSIDAQTPTSNVRFKCLREPAIRGLADARFAGKQPGWKFEARYQEFGVPFGTSAKTREILNTVRYTPMKDRGISLVPKPGPESPHVPRAEEAIRNKVPRAQRHDISVITKYRIRGKGEWSEGVMKNISVSGVLIGATQSLPLETVIEMKFVLPVHLMGGERAAEVLCRGSVVRSWSDGVPERPAAMIAARIIHSRLLRQTK